jgi:hypothetical protein
MAVKWRTLRPEQLKPAQFIELTMDLYGPRGSETSNRALRQGERGEAEGGMSVAAEGKGAASAGKADGRTSSTPVVGPASRRLAELLAKRAAKKAAVGAAEGEGSVLSKTTDTASVVASAAVQQPEAVTTTRPVKASVAGAKDRYIYASELVWRKTLDSY